MPADEDMDELEASVAADVSACGFPSESIRVEWVAEFQDFVITIVGNAADDTSFRRLNELVSQQGGIVEFTDEEARERFARLQDEFFQRKVAADRPRARAAAREWLKERDLLSGLPSFDPARQSLKAFAEDLERHCGLTPGSVLSVDEARLMVGGANLDPSLLTLATLSRLMNALEASNLYDLGVAPKVIGRGP